MNTRHLQQTRFWSTKGSTWQYHSTSLWQTLFCPNIIGTCRPQSILDCDCTGMELEAGCLNSEDWTPDWTVGLDQHTHYYATVYLHHMNWIQGRRPLLNINIVRTRRSFSSHFWRHVCKTNMHTCTDANQMKHWPLSNGSTVNMHSGTLILSSTQSLPRGKSPHV